MQPGSLGEQISRQYLESKEYKFVQANYKTRYGEIDLIMTHKEQTIFVEVKTRHQGNLATSNKGLSSQKMTRLLNTAQQYVAEHNIKDWRMELVAVTLMNNGLAKVQIIPF